MPLLSSQDTPLWWIKLNYLFLYHTPMMKQLEPFVLLQSQWHVWTWRTPCEHWRHTNSRLYWNAWRNWIYPVITHLIVTSAWGMGSKRYTIWCNQNTLKVTIKNTAQWQLLHKILSLAWTIYVKCPLQDHLFCSDKKGCIFDGTALSHSSIKVKENKHEFVVIFQ